MANPGKKHRLRGSVQEAAHTHVEQGSACLDEEDGRGIFPEDFRIKALGTSHSGK